MMDIFTAIKSDHEKQRLLMKILVETSGDSESRRDFFADLKNLLVTHSTAEERHFYAPLIESDQTIEITRHAISEHHDIDKLIESLEKTDMSSPAWLKTMKSLQEIVLHHLAEEEQEFFQQAGKVLSQNQKKVLGSKYRDEMAAN